MAKKRVPRIKTVGDVATFLARISRETYRGDLDLGAAKTLTYTLSVLCRALESSDLEQRLEALEKTLSSTDRGA